MSSLDRFLDQHRTSFWPWIVLVALLTGVGAVGCLAGRAAQDAHDRGAADSPRGSLKVPDSRYQVPGARGGQIAAYSTFGRFDGSDARG